MCEIEVEYYIKKLFALRHILYIIIFCYVPVGSMIVTKWWIGKRHF